MGVGVVNSTGQDAARDLVILLLLRRQRRRRLRLLLGDSLAGRSMAVVVAVVVVVVAVVVVAAVAVSVSVVAAATVTVVVAVVVHECRRVAAVIVQDSISRLRLQHSEVRCHRRVVRGRDSRRLHHVTRSLVLVLKGHRAGIGRCGVGRWCMGLGCVGLGLRVGEFV